MVVLWKEQGAFHEISTKSSHKISWTSFISFKTKIITLNKQSFNWILQQIHNVSKVQSHTTN